MPEHLLDHIKALPLRHQPGRERVPQVVYSDVRRQSRVAAQLASLALEQAPASGSVRSRLIVGARDGRAVHTLAHYLKASIIHQTYFRQLAASSGTRLPVPALLPTTASASRCDRLTNGEDPPLLDRKRPRPHL
jgi:hypothetical protein